MSQNIDTIEVRAAFVRTDVYFGYNPAPSDKELIKSISNKELYAPNPMRPFRSPDGSATIVFELWNLGFNPKERQRNARIFYEERVIPQLDAVTEAEVVSNLEIITIKLPEGVKSLFTPTYEQAQVRQNA